MTRLAPDHQRRIVTNTVAQVVGRNGVALLRLLVAGLIVRHLGTTTFAEYALLFGMLTVVEWIVDFGTSEILVRDIARHRDERVARLRLLLAGKLYQVPAAFAALALGLWVMGYPRHIIIAGLVGGTSLALYAGVLVYRVLFRTELTMERDAAAEFLSVLSFAPMVAAVAAAGGGLIALMACHAVSRAVYLGAATCLGWRHFRFSMAGVAGADVRSALASASLIGAIGLVAGLYELVDLLALSKMAGLSDVAHYSAAQRLSWPALMALTAIGGTLYPVAASFWPHARDDFARACQRGVDTVAVLGGLGFSALVAGPDFFLRLLGPSLVVAAPVLQLLAVLCFVKAITSTVGPLLYIVNAQRQALRFVVTSLTIKSVVLLMTASRFGAAGAAAGALAVEIVWAVPATVFLFERFSGYRLRWSVPLKAALAMTLAAAATRLALPEGGLGAAIGAPLLYATFAAALGLVRVGDAHLLFRRSAA